MMKILIVEDNDLNRKLLETILIRLNHEVITAENGMIAIELAKKHIPDLVLMDLRMPVLDGYKATKIITNEDTLTHIPVVAISANSSETDIKKAFESGCRQYLKKPLKKAHLLEILDKYSKP